MGGAAAQPYLVFDAAAPLRPESVFIRVHPWLEVVFMWSGYGHGYGVDPSCFPAP
jgi:hypothetical protein